MEGYRTMCERPPGKRAGAYDDAPAGRVLTRREAVLLLGGAGAYGALWLAGCSRSPREPAASPAGATALNCVVKPEQTAGPYYVDEKLTRADIRADTSTGKLEEGALLALTFNVSRVDTGACAPLQNAVVDVWHCNAAGVYSDVVDPNFDTKGQNWLRGNQVTDAKGAASFTTVFPGWYPGRASHIHFTVRSAAGADATYQFTSQLYFDEKFLSSLYTEREPYAARGDEGRERNASDRIYQEGGSQLLLTPTARGEGYAAAFNLGIQTDA